MRFEPATFQPPDYINNQYTTDSEPTGSDHSQIDNYYFHAVNEYYIQSSF